MRGARKTTVPLRPRTFDRLCCKLTVARLRLSADAPNLVPVLQALRDAQELSLGEARAQATQLAETGLIGTLVEMEILAIHLRRRAVSVTVESAE